MILIVTGSSTEPALFHAGCMPILHVGLLQHLYLTYSLERHSTHIHLGWNTSYSQWWKSSVLPSRMEHILLTMMEDLSLSSRLEHILLTMMKDTHPSWNTSASQWWNISALPSRPEQILLIMMEDSHLGWNTSWSQLWKAFALTFIQAGTHPSHSDENALHLHPSRREHILLTVMEGLALTSDLVGTNPTVISEWPPVLDWATW